MFFLKISMRSGSISCQCRARGDDRRLASRRDDWPVFGPGPRPFDQARRQAGRPAAEQSRIEAWDIFATFPEMVGSRTDIVVAMDWTDYDADGHSPWRSSW